MAYSRYRKKRRRKRRKSPGMKVAHKNMLKGAGVLFALLIFKPSLPIGWASKVQQMFQGGGQS